MAKQIILAPLALLPGGSSPQPASIEVDLSTRLITDIRLGLELKSEHDYSEVVRIDEGKVLLPGLIEYVRLFVCQL